MTVDAASDALVGQISGLLDRWTQALVDGDVVRIRSFMTPGFSITTAGWLDTPADRETWLSHALERFRLDWFAYDDVRVRRYEPGDLVAVRAELRGPGVSGGVDVLGDGAVTAWTGRIRRKAVDPQDGQSPYDALREALQSTSVDP